MLIIGSKYRQIPKLHDIHVGFSIIILSLLSGKIHGFQYFNFTTYQYHNEGRLLSDTWNFILPKIFKTLLPRHFFMLMPTLLLSWTITMIFCMGYPLSRWTDSITIIIIFIIIITTATTTTFNSANGTDCVANMKALVCDIRCWQYVEIEL